MIEQRHDRDLAPVAETHERRRRTLDTAISKILADLGRMTDRLAELEAKHVAAQRAEHFAKLKADLDQRTRRADFFDARTGRFRA